MNWSSFFTTAFGVSLAKAREWVSICGAKLLKPCWSGDAPIARPQCRIWLSDLFKKAGVWRPKAGAASKDLCSPRASLYAHVIV